MQTHDGLTLLGYLLILGGLGYLLVFQLFPRREAAPRGRKRPARPDAPPPPSTPHEWAAAADAHERHAPGHAERIAELCRRLGEAAGLGPEDVDAIELAALLHDVGALELDAEPYAREGRLRQSELQAIWEHPVRGARKAFEVTGSHAVSQWVRWHHESWDGLGYPDGLAGPGIPLPARILRLADAAESMLSGRPYRAALAPEDVVAELNRLSAIAFDPDLVQVFADFVLPRYMEERLPRS